MVYRQKGRNTKIRKNESDVKHKYRVDKIYEIKCILKYENVIESPNFLSKYQWSKLAQDEKNSIVSHLKKI